MLVVDRDAVTHSDARLLAHLSADEPMQNASLICDLYLRDARRHGRCCRRLSHEDLSAAPFAADGEELDSVSRETLLDTRLTDHRGGFYVLRLVEGRLSIPELRWCRCAGSAADPAVPASLREVVGRLESYEPAVTLTRQILAVCGSDAEASTAVLEAELLRVQKSPIVLNRRLREVTLAMLDRDELSMSEIAVRCGRIKRDSRGNTSGETSWLARRLGLLPDGGGDTPTPWIHSDVLGLIACQGLGISPREVEA